MPGPGEYRPDPTEGITHIEDLPKPNVSLRSRNYRRLLDHQPCRPVEEYSVSGSSHGLSTRQHTDPIRPLDRAVR